LQRRSVRTVFLSLGYNTSFVAFQALQELWAGKLWKLNGLYRISLLRHRLNWTRWRGVSRTDGKSPFIHKFVDGIRHKNLGHAHLTAHTRFRERVTWVCWASFCEGHPHRWLF